MAIRPAKTAAPKPRGALMFAAASGVLVDPATAPVTLVDVATTEVLATEV